MKGSAWTISISKSTYEKNHALDLSSIIGWLLAFTKGHKERNSHAK